MKREFSASLALLVGLLLCASAVFAAPRKNSYPPTIEGAEVVVYKQASGMDLQLWIFEPEGHTASDKRAAALFFFGGGWKNGSPNQFVPHCKALAKRGMVAVVADYRVASRNKTLAKDCFEDAKSAMRWLRANAAERGIDPDRIAAGGGSAGGHLAAALGTIKGFDAPGDDLKVSAIPNAMLLFNPACVLAPLKGMPVWKAKKDEELLARMGVDPQELSPAHHVAKGAPPCIIFHGKADTTVPFNTAEAFTRVMTAAGNRCELVGFEDMPHGFFNPGKFDNKPYLESIEKMDAFLVSLGFLKP